MLYSMKQVCDRLEMTYETLRFYCDVGLVPNVKRDKNNYRQFDDKDLNWLQALRCLRHCGMSVSGMKEYMELCLQGKETILARKAILEEHRRALLERKREIDESLQYIEEKQHYFDRVLTGKIPYSSNLIEVEEGMAEHR